MCPGVLRSASFNICSALTVASTLSRNPGPKPANTMFRVSKTTRSALCKTEQICEPVRPYPHPTAPPNCANPYTCKIGKSSSTSYGTYLTQLPVISFNTSFFFEI
ncbi:hypothetical protein B0T13DRAFT_103424 [Neurospora crassa]|nr:hypothetical protein B0T13DRAFT_103424 [Neurospora crassa]